MHHAQPHSNSAMAPIPTTPKDEPRWYRTYYLAVLEGDRERARTKISRAQHAIQERMEELRSMAPNTPREPQDLCSALVYLGILLQHMTGDGGRVLWE